MANVLNFTVDKYPNDLLADIFNHQHELAIKYLPIEKSNGLCLYDIIPADIDDPKAQAKIKDMSWRAIEEVAEAIEAFDKGEQIHFLEELADALHFLIEKYLLCDFYPYHANSCSRYFPTQNMKPTGDLASWFHDIGPVIPKETRRPELYMAAAEYMVASGLTCNCLKNKPWKQSHVLTDERYFREKLIEEFRAFIKLCFIAGLDDIALYAMYLRKYQVNEFRQKSNY